jgi:hypothetical protein
LLLGLAGPVTGLVTLPAAPAAAVESDSPLKVTMDALAPSVMPERGNLEISGRVRNRSEGDWTDLQAYLITSSSPITDAAGLATAAGTDETLEIGARITDEGLYDEIGDLEPGQGTNYSLSVPREALGIDGSQGAYWVGVHVLGVAPDGSRDTVADGRARTFVPLVEDAAEPVDLSVVMPFREQVSRTADNRLRGVERWERRLAPEGRLGRLLGLAATADGSVTWLVDPAVLDAAASVAAGNPPLDTSGDQPTAEPSPSGGADPGDAATTDATASPSGSEEGEESPDGDADEEGSEPTPAQQDAAEWLTDFQEGAEQAAVMALPYGDLDVAAATAGSSDGLVDTAHRLAGVTFEELDVPAGPVVAPPSGRLPTRSLPRLDDAVPVLLDDPALPTGTATVVDRPAGTRVVLADAEASSGGPGPNLRLDPLSLRQRVLAEAAVRSLAKQVGADVEPLVVRTPERWNPGRSWEQAEFFDGLDVPWVRQVDLPGVLFADAAPPVSDAELSYPAADRRRQVPQTNLSATGDLIRTSRTFAELLAENDAVADDLSGTGMLGSSVNARNRPAAALAQTRSVTFAVRRAMSEVDVEGPQFVTMSGDTGPIAVTVSNDLDVPVTVRLEAVTGTEDLTIAAPDAITLAPGQRQPVRLRADATRVGVHPVTLRATTESGTALGPAVEFSVRTSNVGTVIWFVMAAGAGILVVAVVARIVRRVRARKATHGPLLASQHQEGR